jgi:asparagine synthase (glutamine-hydrolysing)
VPGPRTIFKSIRRVPAGHVLTVDVGGSTEPALERWLRDPATVARAGRYEDAVEAVRFALTDAVKSRLVADVPVGVFLSGGIDSSGIAGAMSQLGVTTRTFSIGFEDAELDESGFARQVARHVGSDHHHFEFGLDTCLTVLDEVIETLDEPLGDPACLPVYLLSREARKHVKVVLSGEGADELFGGYGYYAQRAAGPPGWLAGLRARLGSRRQSADEIAFFRADNTSASGFPVLTSAANRDAFVRERVPDEDAWTTALCRRLAAEPCALRRAQQADVASWLADDLLPKLDHMSMAVSLEGRAPYLEPRLATLAMSLPASFKIDSGIYKRVLRDAVAPWLPPELLQRPKQGFVLPMQRWLAGPLRERLLDALEGERDDGLDAHAVREIAVADLGAGATRSRLLYALLAYREWFAAVSEQRSVAQRLSRSATHATLRTSTTTPGAEARSGS